MTGPNPPQDLADLASVSAMIGADALLIQGPGGNTSIKHDGILWIKASGTQLSDALTRNVFVPCDLAAMRAAMASGDPRADQPAAFALQDKGLRPSIETSLHSVFPHRVVLHVHCVNTLAHAIRRDARAVLGPLLAGFDWAIVGYAKPGADLARQVQTVLGPRTDVVVLANHGLIVAAESVADAAALLRRVVAAVTVLPREIPHDPDRLAKRAGAGFVPLPPAHPLHSVAMEPDLLALVTAGSLYPDHVVFCGVGATALGADETPAQAVARVADAGLPTPAFLLVPGAGALLRDDVPDGAHALTRCLGDVLVRVAPGAEVNVLTFSENAELLNWDAEKYRQTLNA